MLRHVTAFNCVRERERKRPGEKRACGSPGGSSKRRPLRTKRLLAQCAWGPCDPNQTLETKQYRTRRGPTLRARGAPLALTRARGGRDHPLPTSARSPTRALKKCSRKTKKGEKETQGKRSTRKPLPPRVPRKRPQKVQGESQKRTGPRMAPRENHQEAGRTAKTGETDKSGGTQKEKETSKTSACEGASCYYLIFVSKKKKKNERKKT